MLSCRGDHRPLHAVVFSLQLQWNERENENSPFNLMSNKGETTGCIVEAPQKPNRGSTIGTGYWFGNMAAHQFFHSGQKAFLPQTAI